MAATDAITFPAKHIHDEYLLKTGGKINGPIRMEKMSSMWVSGRDNAVIGYSDVSLGEYSVLATLKTLNGSWEIGTYQQDSTNFRDHLLFCYTSDTNYNFGNNSPTNKVHITSDGYIYAKGFIQI